jgi:hypothetical protein
MKADKSSGAGYEHTLRFMGEFDHLEIFLSRQAFKLARVPAFCPPERVVASDSNRSGDAYTTPMWTATRHAEQRLRRPRRRIGFAAHCTRAHVWRGVAGKAG